MSAAPAINLRVDLARVRANLEGIAARTGVSVLAVVKADGYGLGAARVAEALADRVAGWCVFSLVEAVEARLWQRTGKPAITLGPPSTLDPQPWIENHVRPAVSTVEQAAALRSAHPILCIDTGMQRFACPPEEMERVLRAGQCREAFTHATRAEHARRLVELAGGRGLRLHAAATALLDNPECRLDAVRPGLALYRDSVRISTPLAEATTSRGPVGYGGFIAERHGVIICGYSNGLRRGLCLVNGQRRRILEVGMQSAFVEIGPGDRPGDEVVLLGDSLPIEQIAEAWGTTPHECLVTLCHMGERSYG